MLTLLNTMTTSAVVIPPPPAPVPQVQISWDYPAEQLSTNLIFKVYHSADIGAALEQWTVLTNVVGTNLSVKLPKENGAHFFAVTASTGQGESGFANVMQ